MPAFVLDYNTVSGTPPAAFTGVKTLQHTTSHRIFIDDYWGDGYIANVVKERPKGAATDGTQDVPVSRKVRLLREQDGLLIRETWSDATTGAYRFDNIPADIAYTVLSYDHTGTFRAVVADRITPMVDAS